MTDPCAIEDIAQLELRNMTGRALREHAERLGIPLPPPFPEASQKVLKSITFVEASLTWPAPPTVPDVVKKLAAIKLDIKELSVFHDEGYRLMQPAMRVKALRRDEHPQMEPNIQLWGKQAYWVSGMTDAEIVAKARDLLLHLVTHEIDEVLFVAGLGPDPHAGKP